MMHEKRCQAGRLFHDFVGGRAIDGFRPGDGAGGIRRRCASEAAWGSRRRRVGGWIVTRISRLAGQRLLAAMAAEEEVRTILDTVLAQETFTAIAAECRQCAFVLGAAWQAQGISTTVCGIYSLRAPNCSRSASLDTG